MKIFKQKSHLWASARDKENLGAIEAHKHEWHSKPAIAIEAVAQLFKHNASNLATGLIS